MSEFITTERQEKIALVRLNRPRAYNAFHLEMVTELARELTSLAGDPLIRGVALTGEGKAFCAGGDLKWISEFPGGPEAAVHTLAAQFHLAILEIRRMGKPVVAAVNGVAAGGGFSLALACDFRVLGEKAVLQQGYTSRGLCIDGGGTFSLPRLVGLARALEIAAFDRPIPANQALQWGLATKVVQDQAVCEETVRMLQQLAARSLNSFCWSKRLLNDAFDTALESQLERERHGIEQAVSHPDGREGLKSFEERRQPVFP